MRRFAKIWVVFLFLMSFGLSAATQKNNKQAGLGFGTVSSYPVSSFPYAFIAVLEGTYRWKVFGLSILATATSSPSIDGTYWFGSSQGGYQQTFVEPRIYMSILHIGLAVGLNLSEVSSGDIQSATSYGPMFGIEIPFGRFSLGVDTRYLVTSGENPSPLSTVGMFRFTF